MKQSNCIISKEALTEEQESEEIHRIHSVVKEMSSLIRCADEGYGGYKFVAKTHMLACGMKAASL